MVAVLERTPVKAPLQQQRRWLAALGASAVVGFLVLVLAVTELYLTVPRGTQGPGPVDALLVLGTPAGMHGELTEMQRWRVDEAVREYRRGVAQHILFSGGPTSHGFTEADVMATYARQQGVPAAAILKERWAFTTLDNIRNSTMLLRAHGWNRVEVISTQQHLRRASVLLAKTPLQWRVHAAPTPDRGWADNAVAWAEEAVGTAALRVFGIRAEPVLHTLARGQHGIGYGLRWALFRLQDALR